MSDGGGRGDSVTMWRARRARADAGRPPNDPALDQFMVSRHSKRKSLARLALYPLLAAPRLFGAGIGLDLEPLPEPAPPPAVTLPAETEPGAPEAAAPPAINLDELYEAGPDTPELGAAPAATPGPVRPPISLDLLEELALADAGWRLIRVGDAPTSVVIHGSWDAVRSGELTPADFRPLSPPDLDAGLGLATVYGPRTAGWFVAGGRRLHVKSTDASIGFRNYSYESLARLGWAVGVARGVQPALRIVAAGQPVSAMNLAEFTRRAVARAPATDAWLIAGQVHLPRAVGRALRLAPVGGHAMNGDDSPENPARSFFGPVSEPDIWALLVIVAVRPASGQPAAAALREKVFGARGEADDGDLLIRAHYGVFLPPAPAIDPDAPFQRIWDQSVRSPQFPRIASVRQLLPDSTIDAAHVSVWAVGQVLPYDLYQEPKLVEVTALDPTIQTEQMWATGATLVNEPIYERPRLLLRREVAERLVRINARLKEQGYRLKLYDGYRPLSVTQRLWKLHPDPRYLASPTVGSRHNRGAAVDITLTDLAGNELEMPSKYLTFDITSHRTWEGMTPTARANMNLLTQAMRSEGFTTINEEWWHYDAPGWRDYPVLDVPLWPDEPARWVAEGNHDPAAAAEIAETASRGDASVSAPETGREDGGSEPADGSDGGEDARRRTPWAAN